MIAVSNDFKNAMKKPVKELDAYIQIGQDRITASDDLVEFKASCESGLCKTAMRKLEAKYFGEHDLLGKWINVGFGVRLQNNTFEYIDYGAFLVTEITYTKDTGITQITAYDSMVKSMVNYTPLAIDYPINLFDYTNALCTACGLVLGSNTFVNADWQVERDLWETMEGVTYRDILTQIAQATASTCIIGNDNKVYFKYLTDTNEELTYDNMKKLKLEPIYGEINSVVLGRDPIVGEDVFLKDDESIEENGLTEFRIVNNEIIDKNRENAITPIYNALHGISYYPFETSTEGLGWYEIGDSFTIVNDLGEEYKTSLFNFNITVDGGIKETLKSVAETKTQSQYQYASSISKRIKNTEIIVNKQEGTIEAIASDVQTIDTRENNNYQEVLNKFGDYMPTSDFVDLENSVRRLQTDTYTKTEINTKLTDGSVTMVSTTSGTFDENGLTIEKTNAKSKGRFNETGVTVLDATGSTDEELLFAGYDENLNESIVRTKNINVTKYLSIGTRSRIEDYEDGTGIFYVG